MLHPVSVLQEINANKQPEQQIDYDTDGPVLNIPLNQISKVGFRNIQLYQVLTFLACLMKFPEGNYYKENFLNSKFD